MRIIHVELEIRPDKVELYERTFVRLRSEVKAHEPGCRLLELARDEGRPHIYHVFEAYDDQAAIDSHTSTDYYRETADIFIECLAGDHMAEIRRRGLTGAAMYQEVENIRFERFTTI